MTRRPNPATTMPRMDAVKSKNAVHEEADEGDRFSARRLRNPLALAASFLALALLIPAGASSHVGEAHTDDPATATGATVTPERSGEDDSDRKGASATRTGTGGGSFEGSGASATGSEAPPPPQVPESNPTFHFMALGAIAILGVGLLILRRRRNAFG